MPKLFNLDPKPHIMVVEARFYEDVSEHLIKGALAVLDANQVTYQRFTVPGAFEIPAAITYAVKSLDFDAVRRRFDGFVALGCVIRGETSHYDIVANESARALMDLSQRYALALGNGILTCDTKEQALERARPDRLNRGGTTAETCLQMCELKYHFNMNPKRRWVATRK